EVRMLALPAEPRLLRERLFHDRRGVDEDLEFARERGRDPAAERLEALLDEVVIVAAARIDRDHPRAGVGKRSARILFRAVVDPEHDDALRRGPQPGWRRSLRGARGEPAHVAV